MMAYTAGIVVVVIDQNNRPIREMNQDGKRTAFIPFGTEYKLRIKNNNNFRCKAQILIDGTDVMFGSKLVLNAYESTDIERFVENNSSGKKFKFCSMDQAAAVGQLADPTSPDNGRIQVHVEREWPAASGWITLAHTGYYGGAGGGGTFTSAAIPRCMTNTSGAQGSSGGAQLSSQGVGVTMDCALSNEAQPIAHNYHVNSQPAGQAGVTAEGGNSSQSFISVNDFQTIFHCSIDIWLRAPAAVQQQITPPQQGWAVRFNGKVPEVLLNGQKFPGNYGVVLDNGELKISGTGINVATRDFVVVN